MQPADMPYAYRQMMPVDGILAANVVRHHEQYTCRKLVYSASPNEDPRTTWTVTEQLDPLDGTPIHVHMWT